MTKKEISFLKRQNKIMDKKYAKHDALEAYRNLPENKERSRDVARGIKTNSLSRLEKRQN